MESAMMREWNEKGGTNYDRETGNHIPITSFLEDIAPGDIRKSALTYGKEIKNNTDKNHIASTTLTALLTDEDVDKYLRQQWKYGLLSTSVTGIDKSGSKVTRQLTFDEAKLMDLTREAALAAEIYYKKPTSSGRGGSGSSKDNEGWPQAPYYGNTINLPSAAQSLMSSDYNRDGNGNLIGDDYASFKAARDKREKELKTKYTDDQLKLMDARGDQLFDLTEEKINSQVIDAIYNDIESSSRRADGTIDENLANSKFNELKKGRDVNIESTWYKEGVSEQEAKDMIASVSDAVNQFDQWKEASLLSTIPSMNNRTLEDMVNRGDLKYKDNSATRIQNIKDAFQGNITKDANEAEIVNIGQDGTVSFTTLDNSHALIEIKRDNGYVRLYRNKKEDTQSALQITADPSKGFSNLEIEADKVAPTNNPNQYGQMMWRVPVKYNGKNGIETGAVFIPFNDTPGFGIYNAAASELYDPMAMKVNSSVNLLYTNKIPIGTEIEIERSSNLGVWFTKIGKNQSFTVDGKTQQANEDGVVMWISGNGTVKAVTDKTEQLGLMETYFKQKNQ
jgi:hypothetical protein